MKYYQLISFLLLTISTSSFAANEPISTAGERVIAAQKVTTSQQKASTNLSLIHTLTAIELEKLNSDDTITLRKERAVSTTKNTPLKVGIQRRASSANSDKLKLHNLVWSTNSDGKTSAFTIQSPNAKSVRLALSLSSIDESKVKGVKLRFFGTKNDIVYGAYDLQALIQATTLDDNGEKTYWSPVIDGAVAGVEIFLPNGIESSNFDLPIASVSHLDVSLLTGDLSSLEKSLSEIGRSGSCNIDTQCYETTWGNTADAVAKYLFSSTTGTFLCTGTALNDTNHSNVIPYFLTANHCINTIAKAATINTFWFFEKIGCNGSNPTEVSQLTNGGALLYNSGITDHALVQLHDALLPGTWLSAWSTNSTFSSITGIHHPSGDLKKISFGANLGKSTYLGTTVNTSGSFFRVQWGTGTTEGGSSGSGIFIDDGTGQYLVGTLTGGYASCTAQTAPDYYGRFDLVYPSISQYLNPN